MTGECRALSRIGEKSELVFRKQKERLYCIEYRSPEFGGRFFVRCDKILGNPTGSPRILGVNGAKAAVATRKVDA